MRQKICDLHVHSGPSLVPRHTNDPHTSELLQRLDVGRYVLKAHEGSSAERAALMGPGAVGGVVLNSPVGGANPDAVGVAAQLGGRMVWMPTISSADHQMAQERPELDAHAGLRLRTVPVCEDGRLRPEWHDVFDVIAAHDMVLASGHIRIADTVVVFRAAHRHGVRRFLVNHPTLPFLAWDAQFAPALRDLTARLEVGVLADLLVPSPDQGTPRLCRDYPLELLVFGSDLGHAAYPTYEDGVAGWIGQLLPLVGDDAMQALLWQNGMELLQ